MQKNRSYKLKSKLRAFDLCFILALFLSWPLNGWAQRACSIYFRGELSSTQIKQKVADQAVEYWLSEGEILSVRKNSEKSTGDTYWVVVKHPNSNKTIEAIFKPEAEMKPSSIYAEEAGYKYDRLFDFNVTPVTVTRSLELRPGEEEVEGSLQLKVSIRRWKSVSEWKQLLESDPDLNEQFYVIRLLQHLIYDKDVNIQNIQLNAKGKLTSIDHEFAFGFMDPFGSMEPKSVLSFPADLNFKIFKKYYDRLLGMSEKEYAKTIAPLILFSQNIEVDHIDAYDAKRLNWIMSFVINARASFIHEMQARLPELQSDEAPAYNRFKEIVPYDYFEPNFQEKSVRVKEKKKKKKKNKKK